MQQETRLQELARLNREGKLPKKPALEIIDEARGVPATVFNGVPPKPKRDAKWWQEYRKNRKIKCPECGHEFPLTGRKS